jgi:hypothetical protein
VIGAHYIPNIQSMPRTPHAVVDIEKRRWRTAFLFKNSTFKDWKQDSEEFIDSCFSYDYALSNMDSLVPDQIDSENCKRYLSQNYKQIKDIFKWFSSATPMGEFPFISQ